MNHERDTKNQRTVSRSQEKEDSKPDRLQQTNKIGLCTELKNKAVFFIIPLFQSRLRRKSLIFMKRDRKDVGHNSNFFSFQPNLGLKKQKYLCSEIFFGILFSFAFRQNGFCKKFCLGQSFGP